MKTRNLVLACGLMVGLAGCSNMSSTEQRTMSGAGMGAAGGALIGELAGQNPITSALIGTAAGAAGGYLYDRHEKSEGN